MRTLDLIRLEETQEHGTFGALKIDDVLFSWTLEPPDLGNVRKRSCIPVGTYLCRRYSSKAYPDTFEVTGVPGRTAILFHSGNTDDDTAGCILLGDTLGKLKGNRAILNSGQTFRRFLGELASEDEAILKVRTC